MLNEDVEQKRDETSVSSQQTSEREARPPGIPVLKLKNPPAQRKMPENSRCLLSFSTVSAIPKRPAFPMQSSWDVAYCPSCLYSVYC